MQLKTKKYFSGDLVSIADIHHYNEITNILKLSKKEISKDELPFLFSWYTERMSKIPAIMQTDAKLVGLVHQYGLS